MDLQCEKQQTEDEETQTTTECSPVGQSLGSSSLGGTAMLEKTVAAFKSDPSGLHNLPNLHQVALKSYEVFCRHRTADLHTTFLALVGDQDPSWCNDAVYMSAFKASVPFPGKKDERMVSGGANNSKQVHGLVRYEYKGNAIEECRKDGKEHGLRVVCLQVGGVYLRMHKNGKRLAQIVLNADLSVQSSIDDGGLKIFQQHLHLIQDCFAIRA
eukprot:gene24397-29658_t